MRPKSINWVSRFVKDEAIGLSKRLWDWISKLVTIGVFSWGVWWAWGEYREHRQMALVSASSVYESGVVRDSSTVSYQVEGPRIPLRWRQVLYELSGDYDIYSNNLRKIVDEFTMYDLLLVDELARYAFDGYVVERMDEHGRRVVPRQVGVLRDRHLRRLEELGLLSYVATGTSPDALPLVVGTTKDAQDVYRGARLTSLSYSIFVTDVVPARERTLPIIRLTREGSMLAKLLRIETDLEYICRISKVLRKIRIGHVVARFYSQRKKHGRQKYQTPYRGWNPCENIVWKDDSAIDVEDWMESFRRSR